MDVVNPFDLPDKIIVDPMTGYSINVPLGPQTYPDWDKHNPELYERIKQARKELGIVIEDDMFSRHNPEGEEAPLITQPGRRTSLMPKRISERSKS